MKTYVDTHKKRLTVALQMSTHNICFHGEIRKILVLFGWKKKSASSGAKLSKYYHAIHCLHMQ